ncbi:MAG: hypothetical protein ACKVY0_30210, partial [Prosthecobacter sp.]
PRLTESSRGLEHSRTLPRSFDPNCIAAMRGFIPACRPVFSELRSAGLFVTEALIEQVAKAVGE